LIDCTSAISASLPPLAKFGLQLVGGVEVVFDGTLVAASDEDHLADSSGVGFFDRVLDQRFVDHRQHFFGAGLGGWQETCAQPGDREDRFLNQ
jgi:hypothetical protein